MQCYTCGQEIPRGETVCPACGRAKSRLIYVHLCGVIGGVAGSLIGFTLIDHLGAILGGLLGIVASELVARGYFQRAKQRESSTTPISKS